MAQYKIGTATFTNGSATVTGSGTSWLSNVSVNNWIARAGTANTTYPSYIVGSVVSDTEITLTAPYSGDTAVDAGYVAHKDFTPDGAPIWANGDVEFASIQNEWNRKTPNKEKIITSIASVANLSGITGVAGQKISVGEYNSGSNVGNFKAKWRPDLARTVHDGVKYHSPSRDLPTEGTAYYDIITDSDLGVWENVEDQLTVEMAGATSAGDSSIQFQALADATDNMLFNDSYELNDVVNLTMRHRLKGLGAESTKIFITNPATTGVVGFNFTDPGDGSARWSEASIEGISLIRRTNAGGDAVSFSGVFSLNQKARLIDVFFRGDTTLSASPFYFDRCGVFDTLRGVHVEGCRINGNIDTTISPAGQAQTIGFESIDNAGHHTFYDTHVFTTHTAMRFGDGVEGFYINSCNLVNVVVGIDATANGEPGGWINGVHINAIEKGIVAANRTAMQINNAAIFRSDNYYESSDWVAIDLNNVSRSNVSNIVTQPSAITTNPTTGIRFTDCSMTPFTNLYHIRGVGLESGGGNTALIFDDVIFHSLDTSIDLDNTDDRVILGHHTFEAMNSNYGNIPVNPEVIVATGRDEYGSVDVSESTFDSSSVDTIRPTTSSQVIRAFLDTGAGAYTKTWDLRDDIDVKKGDAFEFLVRFSASSNPTFRIRSGSAGATITSYNNASATAKIIHFEYVFDGANWIYKSASELL